MSELSERLAYRKLLDDAEARGDTAFIEAELAKNQLTRDDLKRIAERSTPLINWPDAPGDLIQEDIPMNDIQVATKRLDAIAALNNADAILSVCMETLADTSGTPLESVLRKSIVVEYLGTVREKIQAVKGILR